MINKIHNIDCVEGMRKLEPESIDLTVTSPPYDNLRKYNGFAWDFHETARELYRVTKQGGVVVWIVGDATNNGSETGTSFKQALFFKECGFRLHDTMIYEKHNPVPNAGTRYQQSFEYMFVFSKGKPKTTNIQKEPRRNACNDKRTYRRKKFAREANGSFAKEHDYFVAENVPKRNIWSYKVGLYNTTKDRVAFSHPAVFPEQLAKDHILSWSNEGDVVLDPFMGSGTTAKMAIATGRNFIGFELSEEYCAIARERINVACASKQNHLNCST